MYKDGVWALGRPANWPGQILVPVQNPRDPLVEYLSHTELTTDLDKYSIQMPYLLFTSYHLI